MSNRKHYNSIFVLAAVGLCLGLVLVGGASRVWAQDKKVEINRKPLNDFSDDLLQKWNAKEVDLSQPFTVVMNGVIGSNGRLDPAKSTFDASKQIGDPKIVPVVKEALEAVGDSGYLAFLQSLDITDFTITISQNAEQFSFVFNAVQKTPERAKTVASGIATIITIGRSRSPEPSDELTLLDNLSASSDGNNFVLSLVMPAKLMQAMMNNRLGHAQVKKTEKSL